MTGASMRVEDKQLECVLFIQYLVKFNKGYTEVQALIDSDIEVNAISPAYAVVLGLRICSTDVGAQKIDESTLLTYGMVLANFYLKDK